MFLLHRSFHHATSGTNNAGFDDVSSSFVIGFFLTRRTTGCNPMHLSSVAEVYQLVVYPHFWYATWIQRQIFAFHFSYRFRCILHYQHIKLHGNHTQCTMSLPWKLVTFLRWNCSKATPANSGAIPPTYIRVVSLRYSRGPSLMMLLAVPRSTLIVKFFLIARSSAIWGLPSETIS